MFTLNLIVSDNVLEETGMTQTQLDNVLSGINQAAALWSRYVVGNNAVIDIELGFTDLDNNALAEAGSSFFRRGDGPLESEVINELNGIESTFEEDGTFTIDLPTVLNDRFFFSDSLDFIQNPGASNQIDFLTLAAHELGHVLGFLGLSFEGFVENGAFIGENAVAANGGVAVPLADGVHTEGDDLLSPSLTANEREPLNAVHIAILQDIGIDIREATNQADTLYGFNEADDVLRGFGGDDVLNGLSGNDRILGGEGNDTLIGETGEDTLFGLTGEDELFGGSETDFLFGGRDNDRVFGQGGDDNLRGNLGNDIVDGGSGNDIIRGGGANDMVLGGSGEDNIFGENGRDTIDGGTGNDVLRGGISGDAGDGFEDVFVFAQGYEFDAIRDFENGLDQIDLSAFNFTDFSEVEAVAQDRPSGLRFDFGSGDILFVANFSLADFDQSDVSLVA